VIHKKYHQSTENNNNNQDTLLDGENAIYLEQLFERYLEDSSSVNERWQKYFADMPVPVDFVNGSSHSEMREKFVQNNLHRSAITRKPVGSAELERERMQVRVSQLITNYRSLGHLMADTNPLSGDEVLHSLPELTLKNYGLDKIDKDTEFDPGNFQMKDTPTLENIFNALKHTYTESIGIEYMHIMDTDEVRWLQSRLEPCQARPDFDTQKKSALLNDIIAAETLEQYLHKKYVGQKRFSLEGGESLIPMLNEIIHHSAAQETREVVLGMAHRGRLNVLINVMGKSPVRFVLDKIVVQKEPRMKVAA